MAKGDPAEKDCVGPTSRKKPEKLNVVYSREWCNVEVLGPMGWVSEAATEETPSEEEQHLSICLTEDTSSR